MAHPSNVMSRSSLFTCCANVLSVQVAEGRGMSVEEVRKLAGGRVYTGKQVRRLPTTTTACANHQIDQN